MDVTKMLAELRAEREQLTEVIMSLERLALGGGKRRGRPPAWLQARKAAADPAEDAEETEGTVSEGEQSEPAPKRRGRPPGAKAGGKKSGKKKRIVSAEARERMAAAQRRRWASAPGTNAAQPTE